MSDQEIRFQPDDGAMTPRFSGMPTFMRLPYITDPGQVDIALVGVPWDGGTTNRAGARHGPREIRNMSSFMRRVNPQTHIAPYDLCNIADLGDASVNPIDLMETLKRIEAVDVETHVSRAVTGNTPRLGDYGLCPHLEVFFDGDDAHP